MLTIIFEGERIIINPDQLEGYPGCEVVGEAAPDDIADDPYALVSPEHLASVHLQKAIEATLILSGYDLPAGLLAAEAQARGIDVLELAEQVRGHREPERNFEVERRVRKEARQ